GSHMLEVDASLAASKPKLEVHPLGIGGKADPARLVFDSKGGPAFNASLVDMGDRFRLVVNTVQGVEVTNELPKLPVARVLWKHESDMRKSCTELIYAGSAHDTIFKQNVTIEYMEDFERIDKLELIVIDKSTKLNQFEIKLRNCKPYYKLQNSPVFI